MIKKFKLLALAAITLALVQPLLAVPITGSLDFSGTARLDGSTVDTSTKVESWGPSQVGTAFGTFNGLSGRSLNLAAQWLFYSGPLTDFWNVGGFQFDLTSSAVFDDNAGILTVIFIGSVSGNSYDPTDFTGRLKIQDPAGPNGDFKYSGSLLYDTVPDGGTTVVLLGLALCVLALFRLKFPGTSGRNVKARSRQPGDR